MPRVPVDCVWYANYLPTVILALHIPNLIKVALGHWQLRIGKPLFVSHSSKALHCFRVPKCPIANDQLPKQLLLN